MSFSLALPFPMSALRDRSVARAGFAWLWLLCGILLPFTAQGQPAGDPPQRLIVRLAGDVSPPDTPDTPDAMTLERRVKEALRAAGVPGLAFERELGPSVATLRFASTVPEDVVDRAIERLRAQSGVVYVETDRRVRPHLAPNDPAYLTQQWNLWDTYGIHAPEAWDRERGTAGVVIAVLDTGILRHADLDPLRVLPGRDFITDLPYSNDGDGWDLDPSDPGDAVTAEACPDGSPAKDQDSSWHGLHLAGVMLAATDNGVGIAAINHASRLLPVRVLGKCGGSFSDIIPAILWSAGLPVAGIERNPTPAKVINMSFGAPGACTAAVQDAIDRAVAAGAVVVVAAGNNDGTDVASVVPAGCNNVITVAATDRGGAVPAYSNIGSRVLLSAPGGGGAFGIYSLSNGGATAPLPSPGGDRYVNIIGTSLATAQVSAAVSLMLSARPNLGLADIRALLQQSAQPYPAGGCLSGLCGAGILDAAEAVRLAGAAVASDTPPVATTSSGGGGGGGCTLHGGAAPERDIALGLVLLGLGAWWTWRGRNKPENSFQPRKHTDVHRM